MDELLSPFHGYKRARIVRTGSGLRLTGLFGRAVYGAEAEAVCGKGGDHLPPDPSCTCGFYAVARRQDLGDLLGAWRADTVELEVELAGDVEVHERGWRASHQSVLGVRLHPCCHRCGGRTVSAVPARSDEGLLVAACARHSRRAPERFSPALLAGAMGIEVTVGEWSRRHRFPVRSAAAVITVACWLLAAAVGALGSPFRGVGEVTSIGAAAVVLSLHSVAFLVTGLRAVGHVGIMRRGLVGTALGFGIGAALLALLALPSLSVA